MASGEDLDNLERIKEIDTSDMASAVAEMPIMLSQALDLCQKKPLCKIKKCRQVVVLGMGGSAIAGDIVAGLLLGKAAIPLHVNRDYKLPSSVGKETLCFALSYSGNTEETLSACKEAGQVGASVICITSGGKLRELAEKNRYPLYLIPSGYQPRAALPYLLVPILDALERGGIASGLKEELRKAVALLQRLRGEYGVDKPLRGNPAKQLAKRISGRIPIIFASQGTTQAAGLRLKTQFNENSKLTALFNIFPELNHNEIVNLSALKREEHNFCLIFLRDDGDAEKIKKRMEITKSLIGIQLGGVNEVYAQGKTPLERVLSLIFFGDFLSVYAAILRGVDPTQVDVISRLKKELTR